GAREASSPSDPRPEAAERSATPASPLAEPANASTPTRTEAEVGPASETSRREKASADRARITGAVRPPAGTTADAGPHLRRLHDDERGSRTWRAAEMDVADVAADLSFAFERVDPSGSYEVEYAGATLAGSSERFRLAPGGTKTVALELHAGVVLAGVVRDE